MPNERWGPDTARLWREAWDGDKPLVATEYERLLPKVRGDHAWLVTRDIDVVRKVDAEGVEKVDVYPKVEVLLLHVPDDPDGFKTVDYGTIDVRTHGDGRAVVELAENIAERRGVWKSVG